MAKRDFLTGAATFGNANTTLTATTATIGNTSTVVNNTILGALTVGSNTSATGNAWTGINDAVIPGFTSPGGALRVNGGGYIRGNLNVGGTVAFNNYPPANITLCTYFNNTAGNSAAGAATIGVGDFFVCTGNNVTATFRINFMATAVNPDLRVSTFQGSGDTRVPNGTYKCLGSHGDLGQGLFKRIA